MNNPASETAPSNPTRKRALSALATVFILIAIIYGIWWGTHGRFFIDTDDAYVGGNLVQLTPQVSGTVVEINADNTDYVRAGDTLVRLDDTDSQLAFERAQAQLAQTVRQTQVQSIDVGQNLAQVTLRTSQQQQAQSDFARRQKLAHTDAVTAEELQHSRDALRDANAALDGAREQLNAARALVLQATLAQQPAVQQAAIALRDAWLARHRTHIIAPVSGYIAQRSVQIGQRVSSGNNLLTIVPLDTVWVNANFKEVQLARLRIGQPVALTSDLYGSDVIFHGQIHGLAAGSGSAFSLLPPQNATGNWIKVVQRLAVRVTLDPQELAQHPLRVGLSMLATVDTRNTQGTSLATQPPSKPIAVTTVYTPTLQAIDALITDIIAANRHRADKPRGL